MELSVVGESNTADGDAGLLSNGDVEDTTETVVITEHVRVGNQGATDGEREVVHGARHNASLVHDGVGGAAGGARLGLIVDDVNSVDTLSVELLDDGELVALKRKKHAQTG